MAAAQSGDKRAYGELLGQIMPYIKTLILPRLSRPDQADDIVQEIVLSIHKAMHTYHPDRPFKPWLNAIVRFRFTDHLRKHYAAHDDMKTSTEDADFLSTHVTNTDHSGEYKDIEAALDTLPAKQKELILLNKIQGFSITETAKKMNMNESAAKVSIHRAVKKLKDRLGR